MSGEAEEPIPEDPREQFARALRVFSSGFLTLSTRMDTLAASVQELSDQVKRLADQLAKLEVER